jgi:hypothetical protein
MGSAKPLRETGLLRSPTISEGASFGVAVRALRRRPSGLRLFVPRAIRRAMTLRWKVQATGDLLLGPWTTIATSTLGAPLTGRDNFGRRTA